MKNFTAVDKSLRPTPKESIQGQLRVMQTECHNLLMDSHLLFADNVISKKEYKSFSGLIDLLGQRVELIKKRLLEVPETSITAQKNGS